MQRFACLFAALLVCGSALARTDYGGTYTAKNSSGGTMTLTLTHDGESRVSGTLTGHGNSSLNVQARTEGEGLRGTAGNAFGMLYLTGRLEGDEISIVLTESDLGGKPNPRRASELRLSRVQAKTVPQNEQLSQALTLHAWCSFTYNISGNRNTERLVFMRNGLVNQTPGTRQARWRVQNETLEFSRDGLSWQPQALRLGLNASGSAVLKAHDREYAPCD